MGPQALTVRTLRGERRATPVVNQARYYRSGANGTGLGRNGITLRPLAAARRPPSSAYRTSPIHRESMEITLSTVFGGIHHDYQIASR